MGIIGIVRRDGLSLLLSFLCFFSVPMFSRVVSLSKEMEVGLVLPSPFSLCVGWNERLLDIFVQTMQVSIGKDAAANSPLRSSTVCFVKLPIFYLSCLEEFSKQSDEPTIMKALAERFYQDGVIPTGKRAINLLPPSRTQIKRSPQKLRSLTPGTRSLGAVSH
jgi:hypothetical protein